MGPNSLTFILKLQDLLTPGMRQAAGISESSGTRIKSQFTGIEYSGKRLGASVNELRDRLESINKIRTGTTIKKEFNDATTAAKALERQIDKLENQGKKGSGGGGLLGTFVKGNLISGAITTGLGMVRDFAGDINATMLKSSSLKTAINSTTGGKGNAAVAQTAAISEKYGLNYEASLEGVKTLTGGLKSMNMPLAEQMKIFEGVSTGIAAMKLGADVSKGAMLALGQMASKGTVSAEELRGQLAERIPGAFGIAAKAMNVTEAELGKMMQKGEIAAKDFLPRFAAEMQKTFGADAMAAANGPAAVQERFNNAIFKMKASIGEGLMPVITPMVEKFTELATTVIPYIQEGIGFVVDLFKNLTSGTSEWSVYFDVVRSFAMSLWETFKSVFGTIMHIVGGITTWIGKSELMKDIFWAIGKGAEFILSMIRGIGDLLGWVWDNVLKPILEKIEWVYSKIKGLFTGGRTEIVVTDGTKVMPEGVEKQLGTAGALVYQMPPDTVNPNKLNQPKSPGAGKVNTDLGKQKSESINQGGQRSIVINIGKQIEKIEQHIIGGGREAADEIEGAVREAIRRVAYSLNGIAS